MFANKWMEYTANKLDFIRLIINSIRAVSVKMCVGTVWLYANLLLSVNLSSSWFWIANSHLNWTKLQIIDMINDLDKRILLMTFAWNFPSNKNYSLLKQTCIQHDDSQIICVDYWALVG